MGHYVSQMDAHHYLITPQGRAYLLNQQVASCFQTHLMNLTACCVVGQLGDDGEQLVQPLGSWGNS